jgi:membrane protein
MDWKASWPLLKDTAKKWLEDDLLQYGAALAYYTVFALAPILFIAISIAGLIFGRDAVQGRLVGEIQGLIGPQGAEAVQAMLANIWRTGHGTLATIVGVVTLLLGASGVFGQLQSTLNRIWEVTPKPNLGIWGFLRARFLSFGMVLGVGFLLLVSLIVSAILSGVSAYAIGLVPGLKVLFEVLNFVVSFAIVTLLFAMIFRYLPDAHVSWEDVWAGSIATSLLFSIGRFLIGLYLGRSSVTSAYGAAGSLVVILLWTYYSSQILFFGAEFTRAYACRFGQEIQPSSHAIRVKQVKVTEEERHFDKVAQVAHEKERTRKEESGLKEEEEKEKTGDRLREPVAPRR